MWIKLAINVKIWKILYFFPHKKVKFINEANTNSTYVFSFFDLKYLQRIFRIYFFLYLTFLYLIIFIQLYQMNLSNLENGVNTTTTTTTNENAPSASITIKFKFMEYVPLINNNYNIFTIFFIVFLPSESNISIK